MIGVLGSVPEEDVVSLDPVGVVDTGSEEGPMFVSLDPDIDVGSVALGSVPEDDVVASIEVDVQVPGMEAIAFKSSVLMNFMQYEKEPTMVEFKHSFFLVLVSLKPSGIFLQSLSFSGTSHSFRGSVF